MATGVTVSVSLGGGETGMTLATPLKVKTKKDDRKRCAFWSFQEPVGYTRSTRGRDKCWGR